MSKASAALPNSPPGQKVRGAGGYMAFVPDPLPPVLEWTPQLVRALSDADRLTGRLAGEGGRLANPHLPPDPRPMVANQFNPAYNPYVTIDYLEGIPLNIATNPALSYAALGKQQPYAADPSQITPQVPVSASLTRHTLGRPNNPPPAISSSVRSKWT